MLQCIMHTYEKQTPAVATQSEIMEALEVANNNFYEALDGDTNVTMFSSNERSSKAVFALYNREMDKQQAAIAAYTQSGDVAALCAAIHSWPLVARVFYVDVLWKANKHTVSTYRQAA